jgi:hypothetical protein
LFRPLIADVLDATYQQSSQLFVHLAIPPVILLAFHPFRRTNPAANIGFKGGYICPGATQFPVEGGGRGPDLIG